MAEFELTIEEVNFRASFGGDAAYASRTTPKSPYGSSNGGIFRLPTYAMYKFRVF